MGACQDRHIAVLNDLKARNVHRHLIRSHLYVAKAVQMGPSEPLACGARRPSLGERAPAGPAAPCGSKTPRPLGCRSEQIQGLEARITSVEDSTQYTV